MTQTLLEGRKNQDFDVTKLYTVTLQSLFSCISCSPVSCDASYQAINGLCNPAASYKQILSTIEMHDMLSTLNPQATFGCAGGCGSAHMKLVVDVAQSNSNGIGAF